MSSITFWDHVLIDWAILCIGFIMGAWWGGRRRDEIDNEPPARRRLH